LFLNINNLGTKIKYFGTKCEILVKKCVAGSDQIIYITIKPRELVRAPDDEV